MSITVVRPDRGGSPITDNVGAGERDTAEVNLPPRTTPPVPLGDRSVRIPFGETTGKTIPALATRAGKYAGWDAQGDWVARTVSAGTGSGGAGYLLTDLAGLDLTDQQEVRIIGYSTPGQFLAYLVPRTNTEATPLTPGGTLVTLDSDWQDGAGNWLRWASQPFCPEMFDADPQANSLSAFKQMHDLCNYYGFGACFGEPGVDYAGWPHKRLIPNKFTARTLRRADGRTITYSYVSPESIDETDPNLERDPHLVGLTYYHWNGRGSKITMDGDFNATAADYVSGYRKLATRIVFEFWKCQNIIQENDEWDGQWGLQTTSTGQRQEDWSYANRYTGCGFVTWRNRYLHDGAQDAAVMAHRNRASLDGVPMVSTDAYPEPDQSTAEVYDPAGLMHSFYIENCIIDGFRRQGFSPVGMGFRDLVQDKPGLVMVGGQISNIGRYPGTAPKWYPGDVQDGSTLWAYDGYPPRSACDVEPVRVSGYQATDFLFIGVRFDGNIGSFAASYGSKGRQRVPTTLSPSAFDTTTNIVTFPVSNPTPRTREGGIPAQIRFDSTDDMPGGLERFTSYYQRKHAALTASYYLTPQDAIADTNRVDITSQGTGTITVTWFDTPANVGKITFDSCTLDHPWDGSVQPMQVNCEFLMVVNCTGHNAAGSAFMGPSAVYEEEQVWLNNRFTFARGCFDVDNYPYLKTLALGSAVNTGTDTITLDVDDGLGKFAPEPIRMRVSGSGAAMIGGTTQGALYYWCRTGALTRKVALSLQDAANGIYVDLTDQGVGTLTYYRDISKYTVRGNRFAQRRRYLEFDAADVDIGTGFIPIPFLEVRNEGVNDSEHFELVEVGTGGSLPTGWSVDTIYYGFTNKNAPGGVYIGNTSAEANAQVANVPTAAGSGRWRLAATVTQPRIDALDTNCDFEGNEIVLDMWDVGRDGTLFRAAGVIGTYGNNRFSVIGGAPYVPTASRARLTVDMADILKDGWLSSGP